MPWNNGVTTRKNVNFGCTEAIIHFINTKGSLEELDSDRSVCMTAICYSGPIPAIPTRSRTYRQTDGHGLIDSARHADHLCKYFIGSPTFPSGCYKLRGKLNIPCAGYKNNGNADTNMKLLIGIELVRKRIV